MSSDKKTILIVGLGGAGVAILQALLKSKTFPSHTHRIVAVHAQPYSYWPVGSLRAAVVPGWENKVVAPIEAKALGVPEGQGHLLLTGTEVVELDLDRKVATLDRARSEVGGSRIQYDYVIISTGSQYGVPMRPPTGADSIEAAKARLRDLQSTISSSKRILIVGGGPVGLEFAGEVAAHFGPGKKEVVVANRSERLFAAPKWKKAFGDRLQEQLEGMKVRVVNGAEVDVEGLETGATERGTRVQLRKTDGSAEEFKPDFVFLATGNVPATSLFGPELLNPETHRLLVTPHLSLPSHPSAYSVGDVHDRDSKMIAAVGPQAAVVAKNLLLDLGGQGGKGKAENKDFMAAMVVPLGPKGGASQLFGMVFQNWVTALFKGKSLFADKFLAQYGVRA